MNITDRQKKARRQIESNDPDLTNLTINKNNYRPHDGDWERDGQGIGNNEHMKELSLGGLASSDLGNAVARDKSLNHSARDWPAISPSKNYSYVATFLVGKYSPCSVHSSNRIATFAVW